MSARDKRGQSAESENHVLAAIGMDGRRAREVVRFSFSRENTVEEVRGAAAIVVDEARKLAAMSPNPPEAR